MTANVVAKSAASPARLVIDVTKEFEALARSDMMRSLQS
jgi:hypothetical protein